MKLNRTRDEWAASVFAKFIGTNAATSATDAVEDVLTLHAEIERLKAENAALLAANRDLDLHFENLKADYDKLKAENAALEERLEVARGGLRGIVAWFDDEPTTIEDWGPSYVIPVSAPAFSADLERARQTLSKIGEEND